MFWSLLTWAGLLCWVWWVYKRSSHKKIAWLLVTSSGIIVLLSCSIIRTLPSHAPLRTLTGLAMDRNHLILSRSSDFILIEAASGNRMLFHTVIDGPWADQPVRATYIDDGSRIPSVTRIEVVSGDQFPRWHVQAAHAGWIGTAEPKRKAPLPMYLIGWLLVLIGILRSPGPANGNTGDPSVSKESAVGE